MILGRDFLTQNGAIINHGNDSINLDGTDIHVNTVTSISNEWHNALESLDDVHNYTDIDIQSVESSECSKPKAKVLADTTVKYRTQKLVEMSYDCPSA